MAFFSDSGRPTSGALVRERSWLRRRARRLLGVQLRDEVDSADMAQETQMLALDQMQGLHFPNRNAFRAWLGRVLSNAVVRRGRRLRLPRTALEGGLAGSGTSPSGHLMRNERWQNARARLSDLAPRQRLIIELRIWEELSFAECGQRMGTSTTNARVIFHRAITQLRRDSPTTL
ncbi:MAG: sigma-70 family RNA polymerase sigma factor [Planctomycetota bacterium]|jgi:RNA polymerase sigma-70 factor (ECF subfamily)|nr:sigma-70 family RNA polymerase sigma factor [Planctomycetota bacterium]